MLSNHKDHKAHKVVMQTENLKALCELRVLCGEKSLVAKLTEITLKHQIILNRFSGPGRLWSIRFHNLWC
jgi:hypothetical protein